MLDKHTGAIMDASPTTSADSTQDTENSPYCLLPVNSRTGGRGPETGKGKPSTIATELASGPMECHLTHAVQTAAALAVTSTVAPAPAAAPATATAAAAAATAAPAPTAAGCACSCCCCCGAPRRGRPPTCCAVIGATAVGPRACLRRPAVAVTPGPLVPRAGPPGCWCCPPASHAGDPMPVRASVAWEQPAQSLPGGLQRACSAGLARRRRHAEAVGQRREHNLAVRDSHASRLRAL